MFQVGKVRGILASRHQHSPRGPRKWHVTGSLPTSISVSSGSSGASKATSPSRLGGEAPQGACLRLGAASAPRGGDPEHSPGGEPPDTRPPVEPREPPEPLEPPVETGEEALKGRPPTPPWAHEQALSSFLTESAQLLLNKFLTYTFLPAAPVLTVIKLSGCVCFTKIIPQCLCGGTYTISVFLMPPITL